MKATRVEIGECVSPVRVEIGECVSPRHNTKRPNYKYEQLRVIWGILSQLVRDTTLEAFSEDYNRRVVLVYGCLRVVLRDLLRYLYHVIT